MSWLPYIPSDGEYRIKVYNSKQFVEYDPSSGTWLKLVEEFKQHSDKQQFRFTYQGRGSCYKINTCFDDSGLCKFQNKDTYWGYGYTRGGNSDSDVWVIESKQSEYAKVYKEGNTDPWDCESDDKCVHFYRDFSDRSNQKYVFQRVGGPND
ncbi:hypothetical protein QCA50_014964 [Cerrena zonata]|uniref:Uncharacterized protein n=1 Tax=Cerrena zonata TaxID=2478898 RepID=A0AAW0FZ06_9APHY